MVYKNLNLSAVLGGEYLPENINRFTSVIVIAVMWFCGLAISYILYRADYIIGIGTVVVALATVTPIVWLTRDK